jgi:SAM-dependent methyltransferase
MKWVPELNLRAESYKVPVLMEDVETTFAKYSSPAREAIHFRDSPNGKFRYVNNGLKRGDKLATVYGNKQGTVMFDGTVVIPALYAREWREDGDWEQEPWMSVSPSEIFSLRGGTRLSHGRTVVAGLGLGYQLDEIIRRKRVKEVVLIEISQELVDWLLPIIRARFGEFDKKLVDVIVGDVYTEMPKLTADVAVVDVFKSYGGNDWERDKLRDTCKNIDRIWCWGTASLPDRWGW